MDKPQNGDGPSVRITGSKSDVESPHGAVCACRCAQKRSVEPVRGEPLSPAAGSEGKAAIQGRRRKTKGVSG